MTRCQVLRSCCELEDQVIIQYKVTIDIYNFVFTHNMDSTQIHKFTNIQIHQVKLCKNKLHTLN